MLILLNKETGHIIGSMTTGSAASDKEYIKSQKDWEYTDFIFELPPAAYIKTEDTFVLDENWEPPTPSEPEAEKIILSPVEFKLCFTAMERVAIKTLGTTDPIVADFLELLNDPRLQTVDLSLTSNANAIDYLIFQGAIAAERREQILSGTFI